MVHCRSRLYRLEDNGIGTVEGCSHQERFQRVWYNPNAGCFFSSSLLPNGQLLIRQWGKNSSELYFETLTNTPTIAAWSDTELVLRTSRHLVYWDFVNGMVRSQWDIGELCVRSQKRHIVCTYQLDHTQLIENKQNGFSARLPFCIEKAIFLHDVLLVIGHSVDQPWILSVINLDAGSLRYLAPSQNTIAVECRGEEPPLLVVRKINVQIRGQIYLIQGGPHQIAGNAWDPLVYLFLSRGFRIAIPQYYGVLGTVDRVVGMDHYGVRDVREVREGYERFSQSYPRAAILGHSYGCYLGARVMTSSPLFVGFNGVYDLKTAAELCPMTFGMLGAGDLERRSRIPKKKNWYHFRSEADPLISNAYFHCSLRRIWPAAPCRSVVLRFKGHAIHSLRFANEFYKEFIRIYNNV